MLSLDCPWTKGMNYSNSPFEPVSLNHTSKLFFHFRGNSIHARTRLLSILSKRHHFLIENQVTWIMSTGLGLYLMGPLVETIELPLALLFIPLHSFFNDPTGMGHN